MSLRNPVTHAALAPLALALTLVPALSDTQKPKPKPLPSPEDMPRLRVVYTLPDMDAAVVKKNVVYKTAGDTPLHADVYLPARPAATAGPAGEAPAALRPAVVFVHGGPVPAPGIKEWGVFVSHGQLAAASGFVGVTFHHRFFAPDKLAAADEDVADMVAWVRKNARELGVDRNRIAIWAFSGGGPFLSRWIAEPPLYLRALVSYYGILDLRTPLPGQVDTRPAELRAQFSPVARLRAGGPAVPMLIARAGQDLPGLNDTVDAFVAAALEHNLPIEVLNHPQGRHGFDIVDDDPRSREIVARTLAFLKASFGD